MTGGAEAQLEVSKTEQELTELESQVKISLDIGFVKSEQCA